jgi:3-oxoacyl-(acyl-carrier-protein) synthase
MPRKRSVKERVVVTGLGAITPLALTAEETWQGLIAVCNSFGLGGQNACAVFSRYTG